MTASYQEVFRANCRPLEVIPTDEQPSLPRLPGIEAVLFDIYGTMFISGSGDIGVAKESGEANALIAALEACGYHGRLDAKRGVECLLDTIRANHEKARASGIEYPEVDIVDIWTKCLDDMMRLDRMEPVSADFDVRRLAVEYEVRTNPTWPMPGLHKCLGKAREAGLALGIISNAQFYTLHMFPGLLNLTLEDLGFEPDLQFFSFRHLQAKPDQFLYQLASKALAKRGILAEKVLYVGNDMLNDVRGAANVGFRTALFAGDQRSLRWRTGDPQVADLQPDVVLTDLESLSDCVS